MDDAYQLLVQNKQEEESFSEEIRRIFSETRKKRKLVELFGILSKEEGDALHKDLEHQRKINLKLNKERVKEWSL